MAEMERTGSPALGRQRSVSSGGANLLLSRSNSRHDPGSGSFNSLRRGQNYAAKAAAARLAQVMQANRDFGSDEDEDEDEVMPHYNPSYLSSLSAAADARRAPSPRVARTVEASRLESTLRPAANPRGSSLRPSAVAPHAQPAAFQRPRPVAASIPAHVRPADPAPEDRLRKHFSDPTLASVGLHGDAGNRHGADRNSRREAAALLDEIDMLQEDNESLFDKLRLAEEKLAEKDFRTRELERQVMSVGQQSLDSSVDSLDSRLRSRKEQFLKQREAALRAANEQSKNVKDEEIAALKLMVEAAKEEAVAASAAAHEVENEVKALRTMTHRMILTQEEMEEVVLKRCWLARYWGLAAKHQIHPEIATSKSDFWSSLAPLPSEVVIAAGQRAKEEPSAHNQTPYFALDTTKGKKARDMNDITGEGNIESMLAVEKGLRELAALKVEDAVMLALSRHRQSAGVRNPTDSPKSLSSVELSPNEIEDVQFKRAWLVCFWRRAKTKGLEAERADECIQFWIGRNMLQTSERAQVDVERGMMELRALGIEERLWNISRTEISKDAANKKVDVVEIFQGSNGLQRTLSATLQRQ